LEALEVSTSEVSTSGFAEVVIGLRATIWADAMSDAPTIQAAMMFEIWNLFGTLLIEGALSFAKYCQHLPQ